MTSGDPPLYGNLVVTTSLLNDQVMRSDYVVSSKTMSLVVWVNYESGDRSVGTLGLISLKLLKRTTLLRPLDKDSAIQMNYYFLFYFFL